MARALPLGLVALKALMVLVLCLAGKTELALIPAYRVVYLHLLLLGGLTLVALVVGEKDTPGWVPQLPLFQAEVVVFLLSLILLTPIWPKTWLWSWPTSLVLVLNAPPVIHGFFALCRFISRRSRALRPLEQGRPLDGTPGTMLEPDAPI